MASKSLGLGKGLDAIFEDNFQTSSKNTTMLRISDIEPRANQPRKVFDSEALAELADSIATHGLIQPVAVRENSKGFYSIVAGERRWRAAKMAGLTEVPVVILEIDDTKAAELALVENLQREDLNPIEEAMAFETLSKEYSMTQEEISKKIGRSRPSIANALRLLDLPEEVKTLVANCELSTGHAKVLLSVKDKEKLISAANTVIERELTVRDTEKLVKKLNSEKEEKETEEATEEIKIDYTKELERKMTARMGRRISIKNKGKAKKIEIEYQDNEDLETLINLICGSNIFDS